MAYMKETTGKRLDSFEVSPRITLQSAEFRINKQHSATSESTVTGLSFEHEHDGSPVEIEFAALIETSLAAASATSTVRIRRTGGTVVVLAYTIKNPIGVSRSWHQVKTRVDGIPAGTHDYTVSIQAASGSGDYITIIGSTTLPATISMRSIS